MADGDDRRQEGSCPLYLWSVYHVMVYLFAAMYFEINMFLRKLSNRASVKYILGQLNVQDISLTSMF